MLLYRTEAKGIQTWILGSGKLQEISGSSELVDGLAGFTRECAKTCGATVLQAAAGAATLTFPSRESLESFAGSWPMALAARAPGLAVVQAWVETDQLDEESWVRLQQRLAEARSLPTPALPEIGPLVARSGRSGLPAVDTGPDGTLDAEARARRLAVPAGRERLANELLAEHHGFITELDLFPPGYLAVVHADANGVGRRLAKGVSNPAAFSAALSDATGAAARQAVETLSRKNGVVLARPVVLGGDDFTIIVSAREALPFAKAFLSCFEAETAKRADALGDPMTACAGVAIIKRGWPFHAAHDLADGLCRAAKRELGASQRSGIAFYRVTTALAPGWDELLRGELAVRDEGGEEPLIRLLTQNPYSLERLTRLEALALAAGEMPRGTLRQWAGLVRSDLRRAAERWGRMREVASEADPKPLEAFDKALLGLDCDPGTGWSKPDGLSTPILDALEWRQVRGRPRRRSAAGSAAGGGAA